MCVSVIEFQTQYACILVVLYRSNIWESFIIESCFVSLLLLLWYPPHPLHNQMMLGLLSLQNPEWMICTCLIICQVGLQVITMQSCPPPPPSRWLIVPWGVVAIRTTLPQSLPRENSRNMNFFRSLKLNWTQGMLAATSSNVKNRTRTTDKD